MGALGLYALVALSTGCHHASSTSSDAGSPDSSVVEAGRDTGCSSDSACGVGTWCSPASGACVPGCKSDADCGGAGGAKTSTCDVSSHTCHGCTADSACPAGQVCSSATCIDGCSAAQPCPSGQECCSGSCVTVASDPDHCGSCGACPEITQASVGCVAGACAIAACNAGYADCNHDEQDGCEQDIDGSADNCGACGMVCNLPDSAASCVKGSCAVASCTGGHADCDQMASNGCEITLATDPAHCGACGNACPTTANSAATCVAGVCGSAGCASGFADCDANPQNGCETSLATDPSNCGVCGYVCPTFPNATSGCTAGVCGIASCASGFADCDKLAPDGCEVDLSTSALDCGTCGHACVTANGTPACAGGTCAQGSCAPGYADCDANPAGSCDTKVATDPSNCGGCGTICATHPNGTASCAGFACGVSCNAGYADCNKALGDGCEAVLATDPANCGNCGTACPAVANGTAGCSAGACGIGSCNTGYANCDNVVGDGCNIQLATDVNHCGACNDACPTPPNGVAGCAASTCTLASCNTGFGDCDGNAANGCEKSVLTDPMNCGGCGIVCGSGTCNGGACACIKKVLLIEDDSSAGSAVLGAALTAAGYTVTQTAVPSYQYNGTNPSLAGFGAVVVLAGGPLATSYQTDMPTAGQTAIVNFLNAGNGVVFTEWAAYQVANGRWQTLAPYVLLQRTSSYTGQVSYTVDPAFAAGPVWKGLPATFTFASNSNVGVTKVAPFVTRIAGSPQANDAVAVRDAPTGRVVHLAHAGNDAPNGWTNPNLQTLVANSVGWVARCD